MKLGEIQKGRVALVTGAGAGIGASASKIMAENGATVVVTDLILERAEKVAAEIKAAGGKAEGLTMDVTKKESIDGCVEQILKNYGRIDILVNNAGTFPPKEFIDMTEEDWDFIHNINLKSVFLVTKACFPAMKEAKYGRIINVASVAGAVIGWAGHIVHYSAAKGGVHGFTKCVALALAPHGITVNSVCPGATDTENLRVLLPTDDNVSAVGGMCPLGRVGTPEDSANAVAFLAADNSGYITGTYIIVDGGYTDQ